MQDKELYQNSLELESPWTVAFVSLNMEKQHIDIQVEPQKETKFCCPDGVKRVHVPWATTESRFTILFERFAIDVLGFIAN